MKAPLLGVAFLAGSVVTSRAVAQSDYGIEFVSVGAPGNEAFNKPNWEDYPNSPAIGRGRVASDEVPANADRVDHHMGAPAAIHAPIGSRGPPRLG